MKKLYSEILSPTEDYIVREGMRIRTLEFIQSAFFESLLCTRALFSYSYIKRQKEIMWNFKTDCASNSCSFDWNGTQVDFAPEAACPLGKPESLGSAEMHQEGC